MSEGRRRERRMEKEVEVIYQVCRRIRTKITLEREEENQTKRRGATK
jgi:hypothetical protein